MTYNPEEHKEQWLAAIKECGGMQMLVADKLGVNRKTVAKYRDSIPWMAEAFDEHRCRFNEIAKKTMHRFIGTDWKAAAWWLEKMCKEEGFGKEIKVDAEVTQRGKVIIMLPDNGRNPKVHERRQDPQTE